ncbi:MAG: hypothetical protein ACRDRS_05270 [Pseudonocardiaceae bacterium]
MGSRPARHRYCRCGTHLAGDNAERQCARCQRASRDKLLAPPQVPAEFWQTEQFADAFATQHIGRVSRAYRTHPYHHAVYGPDGISQTLLGQWLGLRQPQISRIEGGAPIRNLDTLAYWARVLRIPAGLLCSHSRTRRLSVPPRNQRLSRSRSPPRMARLSYRLGRSHPVGGLPRTRVTSMPTIPSVTWCSSPPGITGVPSRWRSR